ncbi:MAG: multidrug effflux MFS transporter [Rubrivivax sp.]|nr:multidrug effflux MFS transporter [Rubrivivax sp.]MBK7263088.1 multidrug effflux MFS transporter [Rubrivivax sp.]MBK8526984.1 multidrug effflux MFS transporter [Rubrivivax sp.]
MTTNVSSESLAAPVLTRVQVALALALLLGLQPVTTDLYLPALPQLTRALGASMGAAQQTMAALLLVFGVGQLFWGPVADRVGRRPVLMLGLLLYTAAAVAGALAPSVQWLIGWRALQGLGLAAAVVCARALLRDLYEPHDGARVMAWGMSGLGLIAIASPTLGGAVAALAGWRAALALVACIGAAALAYVTWWVPETARRLRPDATRPAVLLSAWRRIATHPVFVGWALLTTCTYGGLFTILAGSSFVYIDVLGVSPALYGMLLGTGSAAYIAGTFICRRWVHRYGAVGAVQRGAWFTLAGGLAMVLPAALGLQSAWAIAVPTALYALGHGVHQPCSQAAAVGPFPDQAGAASALAGFLLASVAFGIGAWLGYALDGTVRPLAYGFGFWALLTCVAAWTLVRRLQPARRT